MLFQKTLISEVVLVVAKRIGDHRGYFSETFREDEFLQNVGGFKFVQDNQSLSAEVGTIRGLHFQLDPRAQGKLVRCVAGAILDVAVDIRVGSPTYGQHVKAELTADNGHQLWVPPGFAHGFCTLEPNSIISYKVTDYYSHEHDRGLLWNDPELDIEWPFDAEAAVLSAKDKLQPKLADLQATFVYKA
ncbi:dTDP-4-dehydrorhamnose 3,5-epimerase [Neorhizobium sp. AL 9.2.2]|jgi:dTDP-4-dehydrorhamnose 3,5-epimerase|uniref:dTDP-4-dehydrorhamnose 3,5-epimerase n=1 Tax=Neorhizobium sp. AL 9.2.2 TaxID=2712894 RepID=UPI0015744FB0|nr:dTDP-4-dehydrorhamnose 3,5-epimerase [Neorhizobium sp. AL 9.2.2]NSY19546.1 dTDP-4-dehydrorhamnose 3,5-epimerase [Neorhizobium sp. AL 9.2.2]